MTAITVYIDDSAEERRRRRQRLLEIVIALALIPPAAKLFAPTTHATTRLRYITTKETVYVQNALFNSPEPLGPPPPPRLTVGPSFLEFGAHEIGRSAPAQIVTIGNAGGYSLHVSLKSNSNDFLVTDTCRNGAPCAAAVVFAPAVQGRREAQLLVTGFGETKIVKLSGLATATTSSSKPTEKTPIATTSGISITATPCAENLQAIIDPGAIHFNGTGRRTITITNPHPCPLRIEAIELVNANDPKRDARGYRLEGDAACKTLLRPYEHCSFDVIASAIWYTLHARVNVKSTVANEP